MTVPGTVDLVEAAGLPEVLLTVFLNVFQLGALAEGGAALVHGGGSGIGTAAIQLVKAAGARIVVTLLHELRRRGGEHALATLCISGGMGLATAFHKNARN